MLPQFPKFKNLEYKDRDLIAQYLKKIHISTCELALTNLFIWKEFDKPQYTLINGNLCLFLIPPNEPPYFLEPLGHHKFFETINICLKYTERISRASERFISKLPYKKYRIKCLRNHFDYIYQTQILADLKGKKFDGKRNHIKRFKKHYPDYEFIPLTPKHKEEALNLYENWFKGKGSFTPETKSLAYRSQRGALEEALINYEKLNLSGGAIFVKNALKGFIIGSPLNPETISVHFQYGHPEMPGIFQALLWEAANKTFSSYKYMNLEQDLGLPGLRKAKLSYYPLKLEKKFEVKLK